MNKTLNDIVRRADAWPDAAQEELAQLAREIEAEVKAGAYRATPEELAGIDRGLQDSAEGKFASEEQVEAVFAEHRGSRRCLDRSSAADLDDILDTPRALSVAGSCRGLRVRAVVARIADWPESARYVEERASVRVVPLVRYPYRIFYHAVEDRVEILHVHHAARDDQAPDERSWCPYPHPKTKLIPAPGPLPYHRRHPAHQGAQLEAFLLWSGVRCPDGRVANGRLEAPDASRRVKTGR